MTVQVLLFAGLGQLIGRNRVEAELKDGATYAELKERLASEHPTAAPLIRASRIAAGGEFVAAADPVDPQQELALIPPVSGG